MNVAVSKADMKVARWVAERARPTVATKAVMKAARMVVMMGS